MTILKARQRRAGRVLVTSVMIMVSPCMIESGLTCAAFEPPPPVHLTAEQDHQRTMDLLKIKSLRSGADSGNAKAPNAANYDESKADPTPTLPDPLVLADGRKVTTPQMWWELRRPEIIEEFDREVYGRVPKNVPGVTWEAVETSQSDSEQAPVITKKLVGHVDNSAYPQIKVDIQLTLATPAHATRRVPVMLEIGPLSPADAKPSPKSANGAEPSWQDQVLARGWGYALLEAPSVQADSGAGLTEGIIGLVNKGQPRKLDDWGVLRAWAWGASKALDYFETDSAVDFKQVGIEGLSRYGKAGLVAMAFDTRFAIAFIGSSGEGGAKIHRRNFGERLENLAATNEYHWMAGNFLKYAGPMTAADLPVDSHELIALCAPRPVFIGVGAVEAGDGWADPKGMFLAVAGAGPIYKLLDKQDAGTNEFPSIETPLIYGDIAFRQHRGGHTNGPNWSMFLMFAGRYVRAPLNIR